MSKFLSYYNLFPIPDPKEFLGLAADREKGNVVTTLARNVVVVLNVSSGLKEIHSFQTMNVVPRRSAHKNSCSVGPCRRSYPPRLFTTASARNMWASSETTRCVCGMWTPVM